MIKINLVPIDELENQLWWVADAAILLIVACASFFGSHYYIGSIQEKVDEAAARAQSLENSAKALEPEIARFRNLSQKKVSLNDKLDSLRKITVTKISKFEPVIVLEHLQNLKPEGVWFKRLRIGTPENGQQFIIEGFGFDNLIISEFISGIRSTESQEKDDADLRTHIFFSNLDLVKSTNERGDFFQDIIASAEEFPVFELTGDVRDKSGEVGPVGLGPLPAGPADIPPMPISSLERHSNKKAKF